MSRDVRVLLYILLTALIEGIFIYGIFALSIGLDLNNRTGLRYVERQYFYYVAMNIGYLLVFPYGPEYSSIYSGIVALAIGCIFMFFMIFLTGETIAFARRRKQKAEAKT